LLGSSFRYLLPTRNTERGVASDPCTLSKRIGLTCQQAQGASRVTARPVCRDGASLRPGVVSVIDLEFILALSADFSSEAL
jgi:hypothetical protein